MSLRFHLFVSAVNQGNKDFGYKKVGSRFSCIVLEMGGGGERGLWNS